MVVAGRKVKTSITLDAAVFARAEELGEQLKVSRSELYECALVDFVRRREELNVKDRVNAAQAALSDDARAEEVAVTDFLHRAAHGTQRHTTRGAGW